MTDQSAGEPADVGQTATADLAAITRLAPDSQYGDLIAHETSRRRKLYEHLANSDDPLWKEIGTQLRDGRMQLRDISGVEAYSAHLTDTLHKHGGDIPTVLAQAREHLEAEADLDQPTHR
jgi:hypothetical protein